MHTNIQHERKTWPHGRSDCGSCAAPLGLGWVQALGKTSITFGHAVTFQDELVLLLALVTREYLSFKMSEQGH
jgi:hypothetical protein